MPKSLILIISLTFGIVLGFAGGALLTRTDNELMTKIMNENKDLKAQKSNLEIEKINLRNQLFELKDKYLRVLEENKAAENKSLF